MVILLKAKKKYIKIVFINYILKLLYLYISDIKVNTYKDSLVFNLRSHKDLKKVIYFLNKHTTTQYSVLSDIFAIDYLNMKKRFQIVYVLLSLRFNNRVRINVFVNEYSSIISVISIYKCAGWLEREIWDMFGIYFEKNKDLRRILTDYGFEGFPLRKDFPLSGFIELRYDDSLKRVVYESVEITQEFRFFDFKSPWEQIKNLY